MPTHTLSARRCALVAVVSLSLPLAPPATAQDITVYPYLQLAAPDSIWVSWEMSEVSDGTVEFGETETLGESVESSSFDLVGGGVIHEAEIVGLDPETTYFYRVASGDWQGEVRQFRTPPEVGDGDGVRIVAMSDMQRDSSEPEKFGEIVTEGVLTWMDDHYEGDLSSALGMVLIPGDLVDDGREYDDWVDEFFAPARDLFAAVPVYPVPGNHERNTHFFFDYFHLPSNGGSVFEDEHWWAHDYGRVRVIGLDTNEAFRLPPQANWLEATLDATCDDPDIDFVFAQFHHPAQSELWVVGEAGFSGWIVERLGEFSTECGKPSIHFYGHTHGYSRGQSRDHQHLWVNVASAGGSLDDWGEYPQVDYAETTISTDDYGFVVLDVITDESPEFTLTRVSRGRPGEILDNEVRDTIRIRRDNRPPARPRPSGPAGDGVSAECATMRMEANYSDPDGDAMNAVHWQVGAGCDPFGDVVAEDWVQVSNVYFGEETQAERDFTVDAFGDLPPDTDLCWRVRVRDEGLVWSDWSVEVPFRTSAVARSENLVVGGDAEDGTSDWTSVEAELETTDSDTCGGPYVASGSSTFAPAGQCNEAASGSAVQRIDVSGSASMIDAGEAEVFASALGSTLGTLARATLAMEFVAEDGGASLGTAEVPAFVRARWETHSTVALVPEGTRFIDVALSATRSGEGDGGYLDDVVVRLGRAGDVDCAALGDGEIPPEPEPGDAPVDAGDGGMDAGSDAPDSVSDSGDLDGSADGSGDGEGSGTASDGRKSGCSVAPGTPSAWLFVALGLVGTLRRRRK